MDASAALSNNSGGTLVIPEGEYLVGRQQFAGATGKGYSYKGATVLNIHDCAYPVVIEATNAKIKTKGGMKFGSFDPVTGEVYETSEGFTLIDYAAGTGTVINLANNVEVTSVGDLELDGNIQNVIVGGLWGDKGRQLFGYGIRCVGNKKLDLRNIYTHHHCLDNLYIGQYAGYDAVEVRPVVLENIISEYGARQGFSLTGGNGFTITNCHFNHTGKAVFSSALAAGVDIEAELGLVRNVEFVNCEFLDNTGCGMVADSGNIADVSFDGCTFSGHSSQVLWPKKPRMTFANCTIDGALVNAYGDADTPADSTVFTNCTFTDEVFKINGPSSFRLVDTVNFPGVTFNNCQFASLSGRYSDFRNAILNGCTFTQYAGTETIQPNRFQVLLLWGATIHDLTVIDLVANPPEDAYFVGLSEGTVATGYNFVQSSGKVKWKSWDGTGYVGELETP